MRIEVLDTDITKLEVDAIANAANTDLKLRKADGLGDVRGDEARQAFERALAS